MTDPSHTRAGRWLLIGVCCCGPFLLLAARNVWTPYSLWFDELYSATTASGTWTSVARAAVAETAHPPLYNAILALWVGWVGATEAALRSFSLLCALGAFGVFVVAACRRLIPAAAVAGTVFFVSCWLFSYYAQEVRSYAFLLLLSTVATVLDRKRASARETVGDAAWYGTLVVLAVTHYFGLLYGGVLLAGDLLRARMTHQRIGRAAIAGALMCAWPLAALLFGRLAGNLGGAFWITVKGPLDTAAIALGSLLGLFDRQPSDRFVFLEPPFEWLWGLILAGTAAWAWLVADERTRPEVNALTVRVAATIALAMLIDLHTPVSTARNYIVLLPATAFLFGGLAGAAWGARTAFWQRALIAAFVAAWSWDAGVRAEQMMEERWAPRQNWKAMASIVEGSTMCRPYCWMSSPGAVHHYYFHPAAGRELRQVSLPRLLERPAEIDERPILAMQIVDVDLARLQRAYPVRRCFEPRQAWRGMVVVLLRGGEVPAELVSCEAGL